jgi:hypothetical protein
MTNYNLVINYRQIPMYQSEGKRCTLCQSGGTNMMNCPLNPAAKHKSYKSHPNSRRHNNGHTKIAIIDPTTCIMYQHDDGRRADYCYKRSQVDACGGIANFHPPSGKCRNDLKN